MESQGAVDNARLLQTGNAQLAILPSLVGHAARLGTGSFAGSPPETGFRAVATLWRDALHLLVRKDDVATGTIDDLLTLKDRTVFLGDVTTGMDDTNRQLLADLGMNVDRAFKVATLADGDGIAAIKRGEVDAFSATARPPEARFAEVFEEAPFDLRLLDVTEAQMIRANGNHWLWTPYVIPAATYPGQNEDVWTIGLSNVLVVRADVDPDVVYALTRCIFENLNSLNQIDPLMTELSLATGAFRVGHAASSGSASLFQGSGPPSKAGVGRNQRSRNDARQAAGRAPRQRAGTLSRCGCRRQMAERYWRPALENDAHKRCAGAVGRTKPARASLATTRHALRTLPRSSTVLSNATPIFVHCVMRFRPPGKIASWKTSPERRYRQPENP